MNAHDIIIKPVLTEKSYEAIQNKTYVFIVAKKAGKTEIKQAVETIFDGVKVESVNTVNRLGKVKRQGRTEGAPPSTRRPTSPLRRIPRPLKPSITWLSKEEQQWQSERLSPTLPVNAS
ncbi:MAG: 50S ribosomal protein L23 [Christensenellaceae bacterium]